MNLLEKLTTDYKTLLHNNVADYEIFQHFIGSDFTVSKPSNCPYRSDLTPSLTVFHPTRVKMERPDGLLFKDMATGDTGDVIKFVKKVARYQYGYDLHGANEVTSFINREMSLDLFSDKFEGREKKVYDVIRPAKEIKIVSRPMTIYDKKFWSRLNVFDDLLLKYDIKSVRHLLDPEDHQIIQTFRSTQLVYAYMIWDKVKLYQPRADKEYKFRGTCPANDIRYYQGYKQLEGHDTLIFTKSMKDILTIRSYFMDVDVLAPHSETAQVSDDIIEILSNTYKRIIIMYDFDLAGVRFVNTIRKRADWEVQWVDTKRVMINNKLKTINKDFSDLVINKGIKAGKEYLARLLKIL